MVHNVVKFIELDNVASVFGLTNKDERVKVKNLAGTSCELERKLTNEFFVHMKVFVICEDPHGKSVLLMSD